MTRPAAHYAGVFAIASTPFTKSGELDLAGMRRVPDCMIDQAVDGVCILANYSEQFLLADQERDTLLELRLAHVASRVPVIVSCSHYSTRIAAARARRRSVRAALGEIAWRRPSLLVLQPVYQAITVAATRPRPQRAGALSSIPLRFVNNDRIGCVRGAG